ncbi:MAG TPA: hypothetical protein VHX19_08870, partial [Stellaceae bacterium]|nr:hypothetical protein [Stellaceae bacterium]
LPKADKYKEWRARRSWLGHYIPAAEPRTIPDNAYIHRSVIERMEKVKGYKPVNLPTTYQIFPGAAPPDKAQTGSHS